MAQINPRPFADAVQLADDVYELILTNWGNRGAAQDPNNGSIQYPPVKSNGAGWDPIVSPTGDFLLPAIPSLAAIAIAPRSDIDRCIIYSTALPQTSALIAQVVPTGGPVTIANGFVNGGGILDSEQLLAIGAPLIGQMVGPLIIRAHPAHWFNDTIEVVSGAIEAYGTAMGPPLANNQPLWYNPQLRLLLYLNGRGALPPTQRAPFHFSQRFIGGASPFVAKVVPVAGRRRIRVAVLVDGGSGVNITITGSINTIGPPSSGAGLNNWEITLVASTAIAGHASAVFSIDQPNVSYMIIRLDGLLSQTDLSIDTYD